MLKHSLKFLKKISLWDMFRKKRYYVGIFPILGGGLTHSHLFMFVLPSFFLACQNHPEVLKNIFYYFEIFCFGTSSEKKRYFVEKIPILGEGGVFPRGNFSHIIPFFVSEDVPNRAMAMKWIYFRRSTLGGDQT